MLQIDPLVLVAGLLDCWALTGGEFTVGIEIELRDNMPGAFGWFGSNAAWFVSNAVCGRVEDLETCLLLRVRVS